MTEPESRPLAEVLFGSARAVPAKPDIELAEAISVWFRSMRGRVHDAARFGMPDARLSNAPPSEL
jgi:hypothetical protein